MDAHAYPLAALTLPGHVAVDLFSRQRAQGELASLLAAFGWRDHSVDVAPRDALARNEEEPLECRVGGYHAASQIEGHHRDRTALDERRQIAGVEYGLLLPLAGVGDVHHDDADPDGGTLGRAHRERGEAPGPRRSAPRRILGHQLHVECRDAARNDAGQDGLEYGCQAGQDLRERPADMVPRRQRVHVGEALVDAHEAELLVENREARRSGGEERLQRRSRRRDRLLGDLIEDPVQSDGPAGPVTLDEDGVPDQTGAAVEPADGIAEVAQPTVLEKQAAPFLEHPGVGDQLLGTVLL